MREIAEATKHKRALKVQDIILIYAVFRKQSILIIIPPLKAENSKIFEKIFEKD